MYKDIICLRVQGCYACRCRGDLTVHGELSFKTRALSVFWLVVRAQFVIKLMGFYSKVAMRFGGVVDPGYAGADTVVGDVDIPLCSPIRGASIVSRTHLIYSLFSPSTFLLGGLRGAEPPPSQPGEAGLGSQRRTYGSRVYITLLSRT